MSKQELLKSFCDLLNLEILEYKSVGCYGLSAVCVEPDDFAHDFLVTIQNSTTANTTFALSANKQTETLLKNSGLEYKDNKINLGKFLVTI